MNEDRIANRSKIRLGNQKRHKEKRKQDTASFFLYMTLLVGRSQTLTSFEQDGNAPKGAKSYQSEDHSCNDVCAA